MFSEATRQAHHGLQIDMEVGVGLTEGQGSDPEVMIRWSDDGGHTWSNEHTVKIGAIGAYQTRVILRRLGAPRVATRSRIYEVSGSDPVKIALIDAYLALRPGMS